MNAQIVLAEDINLCSCVMIRSSVYVWQMKIEKMAQESRVQLAMEEQERRFGRITRSISGAS